MKRITVMTLILLPFFANSQNDVKDILDKLSKTIESYKCLYFEYTMKIEDHHLNTSEMQDGKILMKGNKYRLSTKLLDIYSNGITQWQYLKDDNEVMISLPDSTSDIVTNPLGFILGDRKDFKQKLKGEVIEDGYNLLEIDLYPWNIKMPYSYIRIRINNENHRPYSIKYAGKDGVHYTIKIKNYTPDADLPADEDFVFNPAQHQGIEIVDLRE
jgi:outer membrane lipoprotein-sorting protein